MESISNAIAKQITENEYGKLYFISDFHFPGKEEAVKKNLFRLCEKGVLVRLAHGIYLYPAKHEKIGILYPSMDEIAMAIAARDKSECLPTGILAMNTLGFSTQVPMNAVYITNGTPRSIQVGHRKIVFKKAAPKYFHYKSKLMFMLTSALKEMGKSTQVTSLQSDSSGVYDRHI
ncbi:MAG: type IV toxin-antitoxin system AbiEi family antitoxin domain-containing protein, partial [Prevotellaceae bacterium]|nr:type IV toxin-antitoxin system AbiEi family antitoxin domain-containing protein [Prevotellaceae bacterium]